MKQYKPRDKITQKMTRDGLVEVNEAQQTAERISKREQDADFQITPEQQAAQDAAAQLNPLSSGTSPPHAAGIAPKPDTATAERIAEHLDGAHTRKASKKAAKKAQAEATARTKSSRLQFTDEERTTPELEKYIQKSDKAADRLDAAKAAIPKKKTLTAERTFDEATGKGKTRLHFEEKEKPMPGKPAVPPRAGSGHFRTQQNPQCRKGQFRRGGGAQIRRISRAWREVHKTENQTGLPQPQAETLPGGGESGKSGGKGKRQFPVPQDPCRKPAACKQPCFPPMAEAENQAAVCKGGKGGRRKGHTRRSR